MTKCICVTKARTIQNKSTKQIQFNVVSRQVRYCITDKCHVQFSENFCQIQSLFYQLLYAYFSHQKKLLRTECSAVCLQILVVMAFCLPGLQTFREPAKFLQQKREIFRNDFSYLHVTHKYKSQDLISYFRSCIF